MRMQQLNLTTHEISQIQFASRCRIRVLYFTYNYYLPHNLLLSKPISCCVPNCDFRTGNLSDYFWMTSQNCKCTSKCQSGKWQQAAHVTQTYGDRNQQQYKTFLIITHVRRQKSYLQSCISTCVMSPQTRIKITYYYFDLFTFL